MMPPERQAATTPSGTAINTAIASDATLSAMVGSSRCTIKSMTGRRENIDVPRSPCTTPPSHCPKRTRYGSSSPSDVLRRSMSAVVACSPASTAAGSPGVRYSSENTMTATIAITGMVASKRRNRVVNIGRRPAAGQGLRGLSTYCARNSHPISLCPPSYSGATTLWGGLSSAVGEYSEFRKVSLCPDHRTG